VEGGFLLDVVVRKGSSIFELFTSEDQSLLIWWDTFFVLDFGFDVLDGVGWFDFQSDGFSGQGFDKNLHTTSESEDQVKGGFFLDVVVGEGSSVLELFTSEDQSLLIGRDSFFVLDFGLDVFDGVGWLDFEGDGFPGEGFHENLHGCLVGFFVKVVFLVGLCTIRSSIRDKVKERRLGLACGE